MKKLYKKVRKKMPAPVQGEMTKMVYNLSGRPHHKEDDIPLETKFPNGEKGGFIISADFELAWAFRYSKEFDEPYESSIRKAHQARKNFPGLIEVFEKYNTPITWATVGHLFLKECKKGDHDHLKRLPYFENRCWTFQKGDWFDDDPGTDWKTDSEWYGPDLIDMIIKSDVDHEISTHTFSHIDFSDKNCPPEVADDEIKECIKVMKPYGITPYSIAFPSGSFGNVKVLKDNGITIYRKKLEDDVVAYPYRDEFGVIVTPTSENFERLHKNWSAKFYIKKYTKNIDKAIKTGTIAHIFFHPSMDDWMLDNVLPGVLEYADKMREKGDLWVGTMKDIADHINQNNVLEAN